MQERTAFLQKSTLPAGDKEKWAKVLVPEMISSEDDNDEDDDMIVVRPLPWRSLAVNNFFASLDSHTKQQKTKQARRQLKSRVLGSTSTRAKPANQSIPKWAFQVGS